MKYDFEANKTMKIIGNHPPVMANSLEGQAVREILEGTETPMTFENISLVSYGLTIGKCMGIGEQRRKHKEVTRA